MTALHITNDRMGPTSLETHHDLQAYDGTTHHKRPNGLNVLKMGLPNADTPAHPLRGIHLPPGDVAHARWTLRSLELAHLAAAMSLVSHNYCGRVRREGDPEGWYTVLVTALGSGGKPVSRGHVHTGPSGVSTLK
jgi:hypothetical protein